MQHSSGPIKPSDAQTSWTKSQPRRSCVEEKAFAAEAIEETEHASVFPETTENKHDASYIAGMN